MGHISGTSGASQLLVTLTFALATTYGTACEATEVQRLADGRIEPPAARTTTPEEPNGIAGVRTFRSFDIVAAKSEFAQVSRATTVQEEVIGELRESLLLKQNWDGEGAQAPNVVSIKEAVSFVRSLDDNLRLPEAMLHPS